MDNEPQFEPLFGSHAIERCGVTITFSEALPSKVFQRVLDQAQTRLRAAGIEGVGPAPGQGFAIQIDMASGSTTPLAGPRPAIFASPDKATQFIIAPNSLTARTTNYVRWTPFAGQMEELMLPLIGVYSDVVSMTNVQLDYVDRFLWTGDWTNFDWRLLLRPDAGFLAAQASEGHRLWHTHSGWFEEKAEGRQLVNVNIDLQDFTRSDGTSVPSVTILTLMREDVPLEVPRLEDAASIQTCLEQLHNELKTLLGQIITTAMADRISLSAQASNAPRH
jgi:uncharacterized protein (TIGR04255 family)